MNMPVIRLRQVVGFPGNIEGGVGIDATKLHGTVTIDMDWNEFGAINAIPTSPTSYILTFDTATQAYVLCPSHLLGGAVAGIADVTTSGTFARQIGNWVPTIADAAADHVLYGRKDNTWVAVPSGGGGGGIPEPANDGLQYGRKTTGGISSWTPTVPDVPTDSVLYGRKNGTWTAISSSTLLDAPNDGVQYGRQSLAWTAVPPVRIFDTRALAMSATIPSTVTTIQLRGYTTAGDGGASTYARISTPIPAKAWQFQTVGAQWWELQDTTITPEMMGGVSTNTAANDTAFPACVAYLGVRGGGIVMLEKLYQRGAVLNVDQPNITFTSTKHGGVWLRGTPSPGSTHLFYVSAANVTFRGIEIRGDVITNPLSPGDPGYDPGYVRAHSNFGILTRGSNNMLVDDCYIHHLLSGVYFNECVGVRVLHSKFFDLIGGGCQANNGCTDWIMDGNWGLRCSDDVFVTVYTSTENTPLVRSARGTISNNVVEETYATGTPIRVTSSDYINIIDNVIFDCAQTGIAVVGHSNDAPAFNVSIVGNTVAGYGRAYSSDPAFADPNKTPGTTCGILVAEGNVVTVNNNNVIEGSTTGNGAGIRVDGTSSNTKIMGNHISLTTYGIAMNKLNWFSNAFDISIENNTILNADSWPIYINPVSNPLGTGGLVPLRDLVIKDNTLRFSNGGTGCIRVENTAAANVLIKNNVSFSCGAVSIGGGATAITTSGNDLF